MLCPLIIFDILPVLAWTKTELSAFLSCLCSLSLPALGASVEAKLHQRLLRCPEYHFPCNSWSTAFLLSVPSVLSRLSAQSSFSWITGTTCGTILRGPRRLSLLLIILHFSLINVPIGKEYVLRI